MICDCEGCQEELEEAIFQQDQNGLHHATSPDLPQTYPDAKHWGLFMVDNNGRWVMG